MIRIRFLDNHNDFACLWLGALGFSDDLIAERTGLRKGQIHYRLRKLGITRSAYRNGHSREAKLVIDNVRTAVERWLRQQVVSLLEEAGSQ